MPWYLHQPAIFSRWTPSLVRSSDGSSNNYARLLLGEKLGPHALDPLQAGVFLGALSPVAVGDHDDAPRGQ